MKPLIAILSVVCLALAVGFFLKLNQAQQARQERQAAAELMQTISNQVEDARTKLVEQEKLSSYLQSNLSQRATELTLASNNVSQIAAALAKAEQEAKAAQAEAQKQATRVAELEGQRDEMQAKLNELAGSIKTLDAQIAETKRKLALAEGDRDYLTKELSRLQSDKAELVRQFNDIAVLRAQLALLREESAINQRLAWMAQGVYQASSRKGAEALMAKPGTRGSENNPSLNVELEQHGGSRVVAPTNAPPK